MTIAKEWERAAVSAAAVHQVRNRLQSIMIEAALLKRSKSPVDPAAFGRIGTMAQDGARYMELFGELLPPPSLDGAVPLQECGKLFSETGVDAEGIDFGQLTVKCQDAAFSAMLRLLLSDAVPFRGFKATKMLPVSKSSSGSIEIKIELVPIASSSTSNVAVTPWMIAQQMARDLGGSLELHSGEPPVMKLTVPACD